MRLEIQLSHQNIKERLLLSEFRQISGVGLCSSGYGRNVAGPDIHGHGRFQNFLDSRIYLSTTSRVRPNYEKRVAIEERQNGNHLRLSMYSMRMLWRVGW